MITLLTMSQGNPIALKRTLESFDGIVNEIIFGDMIIFEDDREIISKYSDNYNFKIVPFPFTQLYHYGFSSVLNALASHSTNTFNLYMNVSEVIDEDHTVKDNILKTFEEGYKDHNCFYFTHAQESHHWYRLYNKEQLKWSGRIHEEVTVLGHQHPKRGFTKPIFCMKDTEKDTQSPFKAKVYDDIKELVYFNQYIKLVDEPSTKGATSQGWVEYAKRDYDHIKTRLVNKGKRLTAFEQNQLEMYINDIENGEDFKEERMNSSDIIHFQGDPVT